uniref:Uncharacterized protein n=1 Tax=Arundo donax TaxID=35708 RepID=A0A0A9BQ43_ARUDO
MPSWSNFSSSPLRFMGRRRDLGPLVLRIGARRGAVGAFLHPTSLAAVGSGRGL